MLENLTKKLIEDDIDKNDKSLLFEGAVVSSNLSNIERYSLINESVDCSDIEAVLDEVNFTDTEDYDARSEKLFEACMNPKILNENVGVVEENKVKRLSMTKEDYDKIVNYVKEYVAAKDDVKLIPKRKMKSFVGTINNNIAKADEVDVFIASAIRKIYNALREDRPKGGADKASVMVNIRGIKDALN